MTYGRRRVAAGVLLALTLAAFGAAWIAANGEPPCGWAIFNP